MMEIRLAHFQNESTEMGDRSSANKPGRRRLFSTPRDDPECVPCAVKITDIVQIRPQKTIKETNHKNPSYDERKFGD